jgi:hypothetical protein
MAVKNIVFDVSDSRTSIFFSFSAFYTKDGPYTFFAGRDCSINLAKDSFDPKFFNSYGKVKLCLSELENLNGWYFKFESKYEKIA